jgi:parvulin-like peptidyl-prolyl isomerase
MTNRRIVVTCFVLAMGGCSSNSSKTVAEVDGTSITTEAFVERYQKYLEATSRRENIVARKEVLNNMINEVLILNDLHRQGLDNDPTYRERIEDIKTQALLDYYARRVSLDTLSVTEAELQNEFRSLNTKANARYVYAKTKSEALDLRNRLERGASFEGLAKEVFEDPKLAENGGNLGFFGWGEMEPALQEAAFTLPIGRLSDPIKLRVGYAIVKVDKRIEIPLASELDYAKQKTRLADVVRERKMVRALKEVDDRIAQGLRPVFNDETIGIVLKNWEYLSRKISAMTMAESTVKESPESLLARPLAQFNDSSWTVRDFVQRLEKTRAKHLRRVKTSDDVKEVAMGLAVRKVLLERAHEAGLGYDVRVQRQIERARQDFLLRRWSSSVLDSVGNSGWDEDKLRSYFEENKGQFAEPPMINVAEIMVRSEREANNLLRRIKGGADFGQLARTRSIRASAAQHDGELGFMPKSAFGAIGDKVFEAKVGEVFGPEAVHPNFVIMKVLKKRESKERLFTESRNDVIRTLLPDRKQKEFAHAVDQLRLTATIVIKSETLENIVVSRN